MSPTSSPPTVVDFLSECAFDLQAGRLRPLGHYLSRYPTHTEAVAREYLLLVDDSHRRIEPARQLGRFELLRELARGGQGRVHLARDPALGRFVALKVLELTGVTDSSRRERFRREIDSVVRLDHPHVCRLFEADVDHDPPFAAMELVPGRSLAELLVLGEHANAVSGGLALPRSRADQASFVRYFEQVARALHAVHTAGIVHRDLKPANLMVTPAGEPRVLDFGLASPAERIGEVTLTDALLGTLPYMAPEQLTAGGKVDRRCDVFALGLVMVECFTGERAFAGKTPAARLAAIAAGLPWRLQRRLPGDLRAILGKAVEEQPERRYATCQDLADDLRRVRERRPVTARRAGLLLATRRWCARHPLVTAWLLACGAAVAASWRQVAIADRALAASRQLEGSVLEAVASFDPWSEGGGADTGLVASRLQGDFAAVGAAAQRLAMLQIRRGATAAARRELVRPGTPGDARSAALLYACDLIDRDDEDESQLPEAPALAAAELAEQLTDIARELFRHQAWQAFDPVVQGALALFADPARCGPLRLPLVALRLQAACVRLDVRAFGMLEDEVDVWQAAFGKKSVEAADTEELLLRAAERVVPDGFAVGALRNRAKLLARGSAKGDSAEALRRRSFAVGNDQPHPSLVVPLEAILARQTTLLGAAHPDVVETTWRLGRILRRNDDPRCGEVLAAAWAGASSLPAEHEELRTRVLVDFAAVGSPASGVSAIADLQATALRECLRLWGPKDPRTLDALSRLPIDLARVPNATVSIEAALALPDRDEVHRDQRNRVLERLLADNQAAGRSLAVEQFALDLQQGPQALKGGAGYAGRIALTWLWLDVHGYPPTTTIVPAMTDSVRQWRRYLGADDPGESLLPVMLAMVGGVRFNRGDVESAEALALAALHLFARGLGKDDPDDWLATAESVPLIEHHTREVLELLANLADAHGDDAASVRLWPHLVHERSNLDTLEGSNIPDRGAIRRHARALLRTGSYAAAEEQLQQCLVWHRQRRESAEEFAKTYALLLDLFIVSDQPAKAADVRRLLQK